MRYLPYSALVLAFFIQNAWSEEPQPLNRINMELKAEQWVTTHTAQVTVGINAALTDKAFEKMHSQILDKLKQLSGSADWHLTSFNRTADKSGLEQLQAQAVARLAETDIANLRTQVKALSKPGETYTIEDIQYTPSADELKEAKTLLRENIYQQVTAELTRLNKDFPEQKYFLNEVNFNFSPPVPMAAFAKVTMMSANNDAAPAPAINVSNKLEINANVTLASQLENKPK